jgi:tRNA 2-thiouridine synthesizing protein D
MLQHIYIFDETEIMKLAILIKQGPFTHQASDTAYRFTVAALAKGHEIYRVFFYNDGVYNSNKLSEPQTDDRNLVSLWSKLGSEHDIDLVVCIAAALRRGMKEEILEEGFRISGLGQLVEAGIQADRTIVFGD